MQHDFAIAKDTAQRLIDFRAEREWERYHTPGNLAKSLVIEASELLEHFQWDPPGGFKPEDRSGIEDEVADVAIYLFYFCQGVDIDLNEVVARKMVKNGEKYRRA